MSYSKVTICKIFFELNYMDDNGYDNSYKTYQSLQTELESRDPYLEVEQYIGQSDSNEPIFVPIEYEEIIYYDENGEPII